MQGNTMDLADDGDLLSNIHSVSDETVAKRWRHRNDNDPVPLPSLDR
jgi:hypothetical protein